MVQYFSIIGLFNVDNGEKLQFIVLIKIKQKYKIINLYKCYKSKFKVNKSRLLPLKPVALATTQPDSAQDSNTINL